jgi:hypothetical protein
MPQGDVIFSRLRSATDAELRFIALALEMTSEGAREQRIAALSTEYRSAAGNSFANLFRDPHELAYRKILEDVVESVALEAGWKAPTLNDGMKDDWLEEFVSRVSAFAANAPAMNEEQRRASQKEAEEALHGRLEGAEKSGYSGAGLGIAVTGLANLLGISLAPIAMPAAAVVGVFFVTSPSMRKVVPATLALVHIRKRLEIEAMLSCEASS